MSKRILAVDDELDVILIIKTALQSEGFEVLTANNGDEGIEMAREHLPDLILLDVMMPGKTGFDVVAALNEEDATASIPVIMLTGLSDRARIQQALDSGIQYYVVKPFDFHDLITKVNMVFDQV